MQKDVTITGTTKVLEVTVYGEGVTSAATYNLRGMPYEVYDGAGLTTIPSYDFKGNPNSKIRQYVTDYTQHPDWATISAVSMETATYTTAMTYDALNRPVTITTPDTGVTSYTYEKTGLLYTVGITNVHGLNSTIVNSITYDAKGQRQKLQETYQNGGGTTTNTTTTLYTYDPNTFRIIEIQTIRSSDSAVLQDLKYWYDPVGNITKQEDAAQQTVYFNGSVASPNNDYTYDALYRLIVAQGREHAGNNGAVTYNDSSRTGITPTPVSSTDTAKMRTYIQYYSYDQVGNMQEMKHTVTGGTGNWTRDFTIDTASNKTLSTTIGSNGSGTESYTYDTRGNMSAGMNHLTSLTYNELNRLEKVIDVSGNITTYYQYDATGERVRKVTSDTGSNTEKKRIYDGQWELYTHKTSGTIDLQRETLHIMDDSARIALIDTPTLNTTGSGELQNLRYQFSNHLNTATLELDYNAANISYEEYYPFGSTSFQSGRSASEVSLKRYRYTAKERDEETGLYYHGARYYAPWLARWIAVDPLESKYSPESSYNYGHNNPIVWQDSTGMEPDDKNAHHKPHVYHHKLYHPVQKENQFSEYKPLKFTTYNTIDNLRVDKILLPFKRNKSLPNQRVEFSSPNSISLTIEQLKKAFPKAPQDNLSNLAFYLNKYSAQFGLNNKVTLAHFLAQAGTETGGFRKLSVSENLNYSAGRLVAVWPGRFGSNGSRNPNDYAHNAEKLANYVYGNRMGNASESSGEGWKYRGRGALQLTGKGNYRAFTSSYDQKFNSNQSFVSNPDAVSNNSEIAILSALWFFKARVIDKGITLSNSEQSVADVTNSVNGGKTGLANRQVLFHTLINILGN